MSDTMGRITVPSLPSSGATFPFQLTGHPATVTLAWTTVVGQKYQVQSTANLGGTWTNLSPVLTATNQTLMQTEVLNLALPQRHYRVVRWP